MMYLFYQLHSILHILLKAPLFFILYPTNPTIRPNTLSRCNISITTIHASLFDAFKKTLCTNTS
jgi:hypothetical protein